MPSILGRNSGLRYLLILTFVLCPMVFSSCVLTPAHLLHFGQDFLEVLIQVQVFSVPAVHQLPEFRRDCFRASPILVKRIDVLPKSTAQTLLRLKTVVLCSLHVFFRISSMRHVASSSFLFRNASIRSLSLSLSLSSLFSCGRTLDH